MKGENMRMENKERAPLSRILDIYTTTFYGEDATSKVREVLALKLFENAEKLGIRCTVVDGGSNADFLEKAGKFRNVKIFPQTAKGMGGGRREALRLAAEEFSDPAVDHCFFWVEPEKDGLITAENLEKMTEPLRGDEIGIVVPARKEEGIDTLPDFQARIEQRANREAARSAGRYISKEDIKDVWDLWFGPKMFNRKGLQYFLEYKGELDKWDSIIKPVINAYKAGIGIASVPVDYEYDESQRADEDGNRVMQEKRVFQYHKILGEIRKKNN